MPFHSAFKIKSQFPFHLTPQLISTLRSNDYFGQYGRISKIILVKRTPPGSQAPVVGLYITYHRREDAARCIAAVDGSASPGGGSEIMRASYGTTKYCMSFLRGVNCPDHNCMNLHEWGDEKDCFTKEDLTTLYMSWWRLFVITS
jgi:CCR4-NOT transcription complex subunit 4